MIITKVHLENITTHKNNFIEFKEGINVLTGPNGTGKSTVLTMIGFALFDYLPGKNQKSYVRVAPSAKGFGTIKIWIVGKDKQEYCIERTIGKANNKITVSHSDTGAILTKIYNKANLRIWIQDQMSLSKNFSLSSIFEHAIGVNQGTFTAPFLMNPSDRSKIFAPLLNVHIYKTIFTKYIDINHSFKDEIQNLEKEISYIEGELKDKDLYSEQQTNIEEKLRELRVSSIIKITNFNRIEIKYKEWKQVKKNLEQITKEFVKLEFSNKNLEEKLEVINEEIEEAAFAKKICNESKDDFLKYKEFSKHERELQEKNGKLKEILDEKSKLTLSLGKLEAELHQMSIQIEKINKKSILLPDLKQKFLKNNSIQEKIHNLAIQIGSITNMERNLGMLIQDNEILQKKKKK
ncbi:MAG: AAA family ATPase, partial [Promethearchaeota archaeon]